MDIEVGLIRSWWIVREGPGNIVRRFAVAAYLPHAPKVQTLSKLTTSDAELTELLNQANIMEQPSGHFFLLTDEQQKILGIDPSRLV